MSRYTGPKCKLCRREEVKLFLKGSRCESKKCAIERRPYAPGQRYLRRKRLSEYGIRLREKQRAKRIYGIGERQFRRYFAGASRFSGNTGTALLQFLELRLDNVVYHLGWAASRAQARQFVRHGHATVNGRKVDIPSRQLRAGDVVSVREREKEKTFCKQHYQETRPRACPTWIEADVENLKGTIVKVPEREAIASDLQEQLIVEYCSR